MISVGTMEGLHSHNHTLALYCLSCDRWGKANLHRLIQIGQGDKPLTGADSGAEILPDIWLWAYSGRLPLLGDSFDEMGSASEDAA